MDASQDRLRFPSGRSVENCRKDAKRLVKQSGGSLAQALDRIALDNGVTVSLVQIVPVESKNYRQDNDLRKRTLLSIRPLPVDCPG